MSHLKERKEKECLNCNAIIYGRFCHVCGQENVEPKETFLHLLRHFIEDVTHFDGKFFDTLRYLILRPGFTSYEYMRGRRNSYLNPIRMYIFTSAIFFLIYFSVNKKENHKVSNTHNSAQLAENDGNGSILNIGDSIRANFKSNFQKDHVIDSLEAIETLLSDSIEATTDIDKKEKLIAKRKTIKNILKISRSVIGDDETMANDSISSKHQQLRNDSSKTEKYVYKSVQDLSKSFEKDINKTKDTTVKKHNTTKNLENQVVNDAPKDEADTVSIGGLKVIDNNDNVKSRSSLEGFLENLSNNREALLHKLPQVMFVTLPFMALMLQLLYRRLKKFYYVNHIIFIINLYIGVYLLILLGMVIDYLHKLSHFGLFAFLSSIISIGTFFYVYKSLRNFYHQGRLKTLMKCFILYFLFFVVAIISFIIVASLPFSLSH